MGRKTSPVSQECTTAEVTEGRLTRGEKTQQGRVSTALFRFITDPLMVGGSALLQSSAPGMSAELYKSAL